MKQHDGKCPVEQKDDLARKTPGLVWWAHICKQRAQPVLYALLVRASCKDRRVPRQVDQLNRCPQEPTALPFRMPCGSRKIAKDALHLVGRAAHRFSEPALEQRKVRLVSRFQIRRDQIVLATEMVIERPLGQARLLSDGIDADGADSLGVKELAGRLDNSIACGHIGAGQTAMYTDQ